MLCGKHRRDASPSRRRRSVERARSRRDGLCRAGWLPLSGALVALPPRVCRSTAKVDAGKPTQMVRKGVRTDEGYVSGRWKKFWGDLQPL
jgi:hypothetical protein